jgi:hypothetical protein
MTPSFVLNEIPGGPPKPAIVFPEADRRAAAAEEH